MTDITVRPARADEAEQLATWAEAMAWETEHKRLEPATVRRGVRGVFEQPGRGRYFIAERQGEPAGTLMHTYEWSDWRDGDWWWIQSVYVAPAHRRQGVYAAMHAHLVALAKASEKPRSTCRRVPLKTAQSCPLLKISIKTAPTA